MANKSFILQGFTARTHKAAIHDLFDVEDIQRVIVSVAFVNLGGVELLQEKLQAHPDTTTAFIGIRNDITTIQGARRLLDLGVALYTVDTGTRRVPVSTVNNVTPRSSSRRAPWMVVMSLRMPMKAVVVPGCACSFSCRSSTPPRFTKATLTMTR